SSSSRRSRRSSNSARSARPTSCSSGRADARWSRSSRRWSARVRPRASCFPASLGTPTDMPLTVAVTGPTGDIGRALLRNLDADPEVGRVLGMARRPFDPTEFGLTKTEYRQGDVLDRDAVQALADEADVLVHLAFIILGGRDETRSVNLEGSRNVFEA